MADDKKTKPERLVIQTQPEKIYENSYKKQNQSQPKNEKKGK